MIVLLFLLALAIATAGPAPAQVDDLPCVLCHPSRDLATYQRLGEVPGVLLGQESAQARVCLSCHNGTVLDHRARLLRGGQHPVGVPAGVVIPEDLPLYGVRSLECGTCHSPHGEGPLAKRWLRLDDEDGELCTMCHLQHGDSHLGRSLPPTRRERVLRRGGRLAAGERIQCTSCHNVHGAQARRLLIAPFGPAEDGLCRTCHSALTVKGVPAGQNGQPCADCHRTHSAEPLQLAGGAEGPCVRCHPERSGPREHPRASPACSGCHSVHSPVRPEGRARGLLRMLQADGLLCRTCHTEPRGSHGPSLSLTDRETGLLSAKGLPLQAPGTASCDTCHSVHDSREAALLRLPGGILCLYCHPAENPFGSQGQKGGIHPMAVRLERDQQRELQLAGAGRGVGRTDLHLLPRGAPPTNGHAPALCGVSSGAGYPAGSRRQRGLRALPQHARQRAGAAWV